MLSANPACFVASLTARCSALSRWNECRERRPLSSKQAIRNEGKCLAQIRGLLDRERGIALYNKAVKVLFEQCLHRLGQVPHRLRFQVVDLVENGQRPVLKDRVALTARSRVSTEKILEVIAGTLPGPAAIEALFPPFYPGRRAWQNARAQQRAPFENESWLPGAGHPALRLNYLFGGRVDRRRHATLQPKSQFFPFTLQPIDKSLRARIEAAATAMSDSARGRCWISILRLCRSSDCSINRASANWSDNERGSQAFSPANFRSRAHDPRPANLFRFPNFS